MKFKKECDFFTLVALILLIVFIYLLIQNFNIREKKLFQPSFPSATLEFNEDWENGADPGKYWWSGRPNLPGGNGPCNSWNVINNEEAVSGTHAFKGEVTCTMEDGHRAYPTLQRQVQSPLVNTWWVWLDSNFAGNWISMSTVDSNCNWGSTLTTAVGSSRYWTPFHLPVFGQGVYNDLSNNLFPTKEWVRLTIYVKFTGGQNGYMHGWMNGEEMFSGAVTRSQTSGCQWHWGLYASPDNNDVLMYEDDIRIYSLDDDWPDFSVEPYFDLDGNLISDTNGGVNQSVCGDGIKQGNEECDDGNLINGDGCSSICKSEIVQQEGICGDGIKIGNEQCDDGNLINGDGCSSTCQNEEIEEDTDEDGEEESDTTEEEFDYSVYHDSNKITIIIRKEKGVSEVEGMWNGKELKFVIESIDRDEIKRIIGDKIGEKLAFFEHHLIFFEEQIPRIIEIEKTQSEEVSGIFWIIIFILSVLLIVIVSTIIFLVRHRKRKIREFFSAYTQQQNY